MNLSNLNVKKSTLLIYLLMVVFCIVMPFFTITLQIISLFIFCISLMYSAKGYGVLHPLSWFPIFFFLYIFAFPVYQHLDGQVTYDTSRLVPIGLLALIGFSTPLIFLNQKIELPVIKLDDKVINFLWLILAGICIFLIIYVFKMGISSKREFLDNIGGLGGMFAVFSILPALYCLKVVKHKKIGFLDPYFYGTLFLLLIAFGVTGERDYIFRYFLFLFLIYFSYKKYRPIYLIVSVVCAFIVMPFTQQLKGYLISDNNSYSDYKLDLNEIFYGEFFASGRNLHYILSKNDNLYWGETLLWDIKRFFNFIFPDQESTVSWFNSTYRVQYGNSGSSGWGFSLIAEGYLNFSYVGVFLIYFLVGLLTYVICKLSKKNSYYFLYYLMYIPVIIYVTRADLANYFSLVFKINLFFILFILLCMRFIHKAGKPSL